MQKIKITPDNFTPTMGAYSHGYAVDAGSTRTVYVTGQIALDENGEPISDDVGEQTRYVFGRIDTILRQAGCSLDDVVKAQVFVTNIKDFATVSPIRNEYFRDSEPVSTLVEVNALVHPACKIEIEVVAVRDVDDETG
jgi:2-iminobutanoate/2-iminopropanoate deaminase